jgi:Fe-S-cluster containining protein
MQQVILQIGTCTDCGACCNILYPDLTWRMCPFYNSKTAKHCRIYDKRPKECREYPRGPMDLARVNKVCGINFVDEKGITVDAYQDKRVTLTRVKA